MAIKSCLTCVHKDRCLTRSTTIFFMYIQTHRYKEVSNAKANLNIAADCKNWEPRV